MPSGGHPCVLSPLKTSLPCRNSKVSVQGHAKSCRKSQRGYIRAQKCSTVSPAAGMGMSHTLLSSWLLWKDTEQRGWTETVDGPSLMRCSGAASFPQSPYRRTRVLRVRRRSRKEHMVRRTSPSTWCEWREHGDTEETLQHVEHIILHLQLTFAICVETQGEGLYIVWRF